MAKRLAATKTAACKAKKTGITFCVDLTHQTTWVMKNGKVFVKPTVTRTGMKGYRTPAGTFKINKRTKKEWSDPYEVWLPYWQRFIGGRGLPPDHHLHPRQVARLARLRQPAPAGRQDVLRHRQDRHRR